MTESLLDRALREYPPGVTLPQLTTAASDEALAATIYQRGRAAVVMQHQHEARNAFDALMAARFSPRYRIQNYFLRYEQDVRLAIAQGGGGAGWWDAAVFALRHAILAKEWLATETANLTSMDQLDAQAAMIRDGGAHAAEVYAANQVAAAAHHAQTLERMQAAVTPASVIAGLASRGIILSVSKSGGILASLADRLTDADRVHLKLHKAPIVALLSSALKEVA